MTRVLYWIGSFLTKFGQFLTNLIVWITLIVNILIWGIIALLGALVMIPWWVGCYWAKRIKIKYQEHKHNRSVQKAKNRLNRWRVF